MLSFCTSLCLRLLICWSAFLFVCLWQIFVFVCLSVYLSVWLYECVYFSVCLSACLYITVCLSILSVSSVCRFLSSCVGTLPRLLFQHTHAYSFTRFPVYTSGCSSAVCFPPSVMPRSMMLDSRMKGRPPLQYLPSNTFISV